MVANLLGRWHGACDASSALTLARREALRTIIIFCLADSMRYAGMTAKKYKP
jgi:hypothetical protein